MNEQGGSIANRQGKDLEEQVELRLSRRGYIRLSDEQKRLMITQDGRIDGVGSKWYATQVALSRNLYGAKWRLDFYVYNAELFPKGLHIEVKWQSSGGSVDEKYVFTVMSLAELEGDKVFLLAGPGARQGARRWLKQWAARRRQFLFFDSSDDFMDWTNKAL